MRKVEKELARKLRKEGNSIKEIEKIVGVSRSSISVWVRDIELNEQQKSDLNRKGQSSETREKRRLTRLRNETRRRSVFLRNGIQMINELQAIDMFALGLGLYWGEGTKTGRGRIELSNADPRVIQLFLHFLIETCKFPITNVHAHIGMYSHQTVNAAEEYWVNVTGIPRSQFSKTSIQRSRSGKGERDALPYGTLNIAVYDTQARITLEGWIQGVYKRIFPHSTELHSFTKLRI